MLLRSTGWRKKHVQKLTGNSCKKRQGTVNDLPAQVPAGLAQRQSGLYSCRRRQTKCRQGHSQSGQPAMAGTDDWQPRSDPCSETQRSCQPHTGPTLFRCTGTPAVIGTSHRQHQEMKPTTDTHRQILFHFIDCIPDRFTTSHDYITNRKLANK